REMGIPAVVGTGNATKILKDGMKITIDGFEGKIYEGEVAETKLTEVKPIVRTKTKLKLILDLPDFAERAAQSGIDAIGLMRLEGVIATMGKHPLQYEKENDLNSYTEILKKGIEKISKLFNLIWIRTSDIRTDEFSSLKGAPAREINPMLGNHGIRFSLKHPHIFKAELRAIQEVAEKYPDKKFGVMCPQIILIEEVKQAKKMFNEFKTPNMEFGVMVETPAAVQIIDDICKEVHFVSLGTNDLTQFTLAVDRGEDSVQDLYNELNPAIFSEIKKVLDSCVKHRVKSSICGQAGSKKEMAEFLLRNKIDSISVNADAAHDISVFIKNLEDSMSSSSDDDNDDARIEEVDNQESQISQTLYGMRKEQIVIRKDNSINQNPKPSVAQPSGSNSNNRERNWQNRMKKKLIKQWANPEIHYQVSEKVGKMDNLNRIDKKILEIKKEVREEKAEKLAENKVMEDKIEVDVEKDNIDVESYGDEDDKDSEGESSEKSGSGEYNSKESYGDDESEMSF
ncbi:MAG: putative PEP-binding protein, partial [Nanoarchaeota archaeon]